MSENIARKIREGEEVNDQSLLRYLNSILNFSETALEILQYPAGFSNLTYLVKIANGEYVLRRPPHGANIKSGHDMAREFRVLDRLHTVYDKVPKVIAFCEDETVIGAPFYLMEKVDGNILRAHMNESDWPEPENMAKIAVALVHALADLHEVNYSAARLEELGRPFGYTERQVSGWSKRYKKSATDEIAAMDKVSKWLHENIPDDKVAPCLIHNDFKYDNVVMHPTHRAEIRAILDWEMCTIGHPLMDLGTSLGYWVNEDDPDWLKEFSLSPTTIPGNPSRGAVAEIYMSRRNLQRSNITFYYVFGLFKIAVIVQQIYFRYKKGLTSDPRFSGLINAVKGLSAQALQALTKDRLDNLY